MFVNYSRTPRCNKPIRFYNRKSKSKSKNKTKHTHTQKLL